jgi:hypothetical protein
LKGDQLVGTSVVLWAALLGVSMAVGKAGPSDLSVVSMAVLLERMDDSWAALRASE